jgi:hypothetical protein
VLLAASKNQEQSEIDHHGQDLEEEWTRVQAKTARSEHSRMVLESLDDGRVTAAEQGALAVDMTAKGLRPRQEKDGAIKRTPQAKDKLTHQERLIREEERRIYKEEEMKRSKALVDRKRRKRQSMIVTSPSYRRTQSSHGVNKSGDGFLISPSHARHARHGSVITSKSRDAQDEDPLEESNDSMGLSLSGSLAQFQATLPDSARIEEESPNEDEDAEADISDADADAGSRSPPLSPQPSSASQPPSAPRDEGGDGDVEEDEDDTRMARERAIRRQEVLLLRNKEKHAATMIQSSFRGHSTRRNNERKKATAAKRAQIKAQLAKLAQQEEEAAQMQQQTQRSGAEMSLSQPDLEEEAARRQAEEALRREQQLLEEHKRMEVDERNKEQEMQFIQVQSLRREVALLRDQLHQAGPSSSSPADAVQSALSPTGSDVDNSLTESESSFAPSDLDASTDLEVTQIDMGASIDRCEYDLSEGELDMTTGGRTYVFTKQTVPDRFLRTSVSFAGDATDLKLSTDSEYPLTASNVFASTNTLASSMDTSTNLSMGQIDPRVVEHLKQQQQEAHASESMDHLDESMDVVALRQEQQSVSASAESILEDIDALFDE